MQSNHFVAAKASNANLYFFHLVSLGLKSALACYILFVFHFTSCYGGEMSENKLQLCLRSLLDGSGSGDNFELSYSTIDINMKKGQLPNYVGYFLYRKVSRDDGRPLVVFLNGGPGASSAYLHLALAGPLIVNQSPETQRSRAGLICNSLSWLPKADLMFIDPVGTGFAAANNKDDDANLKYYDSAYEIQYLTKIIALTRARANKSDSPLVLVGESYGAFRALKISSMLWADYETPVSGLILLSPVLDFQWFELADNRPWIYASRIPSMAAIYSAVKKKQVSPARMIEAERFARDVYLPMLLQGGPANPFAKNSVKIIGTLQKIIGMEKRSLINSNMRVSTRDFLSNVHPGPVYSTAFDGVKESASSGALDNNSSEDFYFNSLRVSIQSGMQELLLTTPQMTSSLSNKLYTVYNDNIMKNWKWLRGSRQIEAMTDLRNILALQKGTKIVIAHGIHDLQTPYYATKLMISQLPQSLRGSTIRMLTLNGGHMFYLNPASRKEIFSEFNGLLGAIVK